MCIRDRPSLSICTNADRASVQVIRSSLGGHAPPVVQSGCGDRSSGEKYMYLRHALRLEHFADEPLPYLARNLARRLSDFGILE
eukprot:105645-Alexandrium_andersonii.AAC.1